MKKTLLLALVAFLGTTLVKASTGSITINSPAFPTTVEAGANLSVNMTYVADSDGKINWGLFATKNGGTEMDWGTWKTGGEIAISATEGTTIDYDFAIPSTLNSDDLAEGETYVLTLALHDGTGEYYWSNVGNSITITASSVVSNMIDYMETPPSEIAQGDTIDVKIKYTVAAEDTLQLKVSVTKYGAGYSWINGDLVVAYLGARTETTTTPVEETIQLIVPADAAISASLTNGEFYVFDIGIYTNSWGYINSVKSDVTILAATDPNVGLPANMEQQVKAYPNPASSQLMLEGLDVGSDIMVYNLAGKQVMQMLVSETITKVDVSELPQGIYFVKSNNATLKFMKN